MRVSADLELCMAYSNCVIECPEVFDIEEDSGKVIILAEVVGPDLEGPVRKAVGACPTKALAIVQ